MTYYSAQQIPTVIRGEILVGAIDCTARLRTSETLGGTPTISVSSAGLAVSAVAVTTAAWTINGTTVSAGLAVSFTMSSTAATADEVYTLTLSSTTSGGQTIMERVQCRVVA